MKTHEQVVLERIAEIGFVDNVWCFDHHILRLGDIIFKLRKRGHKYRTVMDEHKNCHYYPIIDSEKVEAINAMDPYERKNERDNGGMPLLRDTVRGNGNAGPLFSAQQ